MTSFRFLPVLFFVLPLFVACLKDELAGIEADIVSVHLEPTAAARLLGTTAAPVRQVSANDTDIVFTLAADADTALLRTLSPTFTLSNGATLRCLDGDRPDFRQRRRVAYEVTSQDRQWKRRYTMSFVPAADFPEFFGFEDHALNSPDPHYFTWFEKNADGTARNFWASGNPGFLLSRYDAKPDEYPTSVEAKGRIGTALRLVTQSTGELGAAFGKPIAAGNLFVGSFDLAGALLNPLAATRFGVPVNRIPTRFSGYYKWQPGEVFTNAQRKAAQGPAPDGKDAPRIYAVAYRNVDAQGNAVTLDGSNILSSPLVVAVALLDDFTVTGVQESSAWVHFDLPFARRAPIDDRLLDRHGYSLALVFTSSRDGAEFAGAVGSTLLVDDCRLTF